MNHLNLVACSPKRIWFFIPSSLNDMLFWWGIVYGRSSAVIPSQQSRVSRELILCHCLSFEYWRYFACKLPLQDTSLHFWGGRQESSERRVCQVWISSLLPAQACIEYSGWLGPPLHCAKQRNWSPLIHLHVECMCLWLLILRWIDPEWMKRKSWAREIDDREGVRSRSVERRIREELSAKQIWHMVAYISYICVSVCVKCTVENSS